MEKLNAAQVLQFYIWRTDFPTNAISVVDKEGFKIDQQRLLEYLLDFQKFLFDFDEQNNKK